MIDFIVLYHIHIIIGSLIMTDKNQLFLIAFDESTVLALQDRIQQRG